MAHGKPAKIQNSSMRSRYEADNQLDDNGRPMGEQAFADMTDRQNDEVSPLKLGFGSLSVLVHLLVGLQYQGWRSNSLSCVQQKSEIKQSSIDLLVMQILATSFKLNLSVVHRLGSFAVSFHTILERDTLVDL